MSGSRKYIGEYTSKSRPRLYWTWLNMIRRCENPKSPDYHRYGAIGISVCEEWHDLSTFLDWAYSHNWAEGLTLDRIDNEGNYCPENCRWADRHTQCNNKRTNTFLEFNGKKQTVANWAHEHGVLPEVLYGRIESGWPVEDVIQTPLGDTPKFKRGSSVKVVEYKGESHTLLEWSKITGLSACCIGYRIKAGWTVEDALTKPSLRGAKKSS